VASVMAVASLASLTSRISSIFQTSLFVRNLTVNMTFSLDHINHNRIDIRYNMQT
jgi:hypothetical protein